MLGGSSGINVQALIAPSKFDIDAWEKLGNSGWNWEVLAPYFKKFYTLKSPPPETCEYLGLDWINEDVRGVSGPVQASFNGVLEDPIPKAWIDTFRNLGYSITGDPFSGKFTGGYSSPSTVDIVSKERSYAATAYYLPASTRPNLRLRTSALVKSIVLEGTDGNCTATEVQYIHLGKECAAKACKEVILAAGVFQSPKLLELSGIGAPSLLQSHNIPIRIDNPHVGENLQDHVMVGMGFEVKDGLATSDDLLRQDEKATQAAMTAYQTSKTGPLCSSGATSFAFMPIVEFLDDNGKAELNKMLEMCNAEVNSGPIQQELSQLVRSVLRNPKESSGAFVTFAAQMQCGDSLEYSAAFYGKPQPGNFITISAALLHPLSVGNVHITSANPTQAPAIDPRYLSHPLDIEILARHVKYLETIAATEPFASYLKPNGKRNTPTAYAKDLDAAKAHLRREGVSFSHCVGSCAMLPRDKGGVVSERLIVYGTKNLRVVDASIMPVIPQSNTQSTVYAVAERAADIIKMDCGLMEAAVNGMNQESFFNRAGWGDEY